MKKVLYLLFTYSIIVCVSGCLGYKELPVEYDYSYKGRFTKYRSFDLFEQPVIDGDSSMEKSIIEQTIITKMKFQGYKRKKEKPNILIAYKIFYDSLTFNGYTQPDIESWVRSYDDDEDYHTKKLNLKTGTVLIQFYDRKQQKSIWQGYATSNFGDIEYGNERNLRNAVISILDKYRFLAEGFLEKEQQSGGSVNGL